MITLTIIFGILGSCLLSVLVGIIGSRRRIGFGWAFLISALLTPFIGLLVVLISDPLPGEERRWGCIGTLLAIFGALFLILFLLLLLSGGAALALA